MTTAVSLIARITIIISTLFWTFLLVIFALGLPILLSASTKLAAGFVAVAFILAIIATWLIRTISYTQSTRPVFFVFVKPFLFLLFALVGITTLPLYYLTYKAETNPLLLPRTEISNGEKTIVFQGMFHIGDNLFFNSVRHELDGALSHGHKIFYEGIKSTTPENNVWYTQAGSAYDISKHYKDLASACTIQFHPDYAQLAGDKTTPESGQSLVVDLDTAQLKAEYDRLIRDDNAFAFSMSRVSHNDKTQSLQKHIGTMLDSIKKNIEHPQKINRALCDGFFSWALAHDNKTDSPMNRIMLDLRNKHLVNSLINEPTSKIYVLYNPEHFTGVLELLREADSRWEIKSVTWLRSLTP